MARAGMFLAAFATACVAQDTVTGKEVARELLETLITKQGGDWALPCAELRVPFLWREAGHGHGLLDWWKRRKEDGFLEALEETWAAGDNRVNKSTEIPAEVLRWGTDGSAPFPWEFPEKRLNSYFKSIFWDIKACMWWYGYSLDISKFDLFYGDAFSFVRDNKTDFGIVFHAKEFPEDLSYGHPGSGFNTSDPSYAVRNIVWLASQSRPYIIKGVDTPGMERLFFPDWLKLGEEDWMDEYYYQVKKANTLDIEHFAANGAYLGGINYFTRSTVANLTGQHRPHDALFFV
eukprot:TRINITY_DN69_c0_g2_i1.p1 TRINITY_DN69_c0_g2~~TRINITY_DN69_c0_g2_i1.p1  ORF type:complete len:290 (+),score=134.65 TRINITY_DN69_c0_g2_i1:51-920(+)